MKLVHIYLKCTKLLSLCTWFISQNESPQLFTVYINSNALFHMRGSKYTLPVWLPSGVAHALYFLLSRFQIKSPVRVWSRQNKRLGHFASIFTCRQDIDIPRACAAIWYVNKCPRNQERGWQLKNVSSERTHAHISHPRYKFTHISSCIKNCPMSVVSGVSLYRSRWVLVIVRVTFDLCREPLNWSKSLNRVMSASVMRMRARRIRKLVYSTIRGDSIYTISLLHKPALVPSAPAKWPQLRADGLLLDLWGICRIIFILGANHSIKNTIEHS